MKVYVANEHVPKGQVTPYVVCVAYAGGLRIAYAITVLAYAEDMPLDAYAEALRGLTPTWVLLTPKSIWPRLLHSMMTGVLERAQMK